MRRLLIGIVVLVAIAGGAFAVWQNQKAKRAKEERQRIVLLEDNLVTLRMAIHKFRRDNSRYPHTLQELVPSYLREVPVDPITGSANWRLTTEEVVTPSEDFSAQTTPKSESVIIEVHSSAPGADANGKAFADY